MLKKSIICFALLLSVSGLLVSCSKKDGNTITVYAYDSFCSSWGAGPEIVRQFEEKTSVHVNLVSCGSGPEMYSRILLEGSSCPADVVIGLSDTFEIDSSLFSHFIPKSKESLISYDESNNVVPFDWGIIALNFNGESGDTQIPLCLEDLAKPEYSKKFILIDPRTSSVGLSSLLWTIEVFGETKTFEWWKTVTENALTVAPSWSMAYGLFTEGEAPLVLSYSTSPAYHIMNNEDFRSTAIPFEEGNYRTVEYLGITSFSDSKEKAEQFCNFVLSEGQNMIAVANTMLPANKETVLPQAFDNLMNFRILNEENTANVSEIDRYLDKWTEAVGGK